ncbi:MAG: hypothetical protein HYT81_12450 [Gemmatimonadetes bacterium]|nr:hypothetical protein [Gemmatimonadota bacterium]
MALAVDRRYDRVPRLPGVDEQVREAVLHRMEQPFPFAALAARFPDVTAPRLRRVLDQLRREGRIVRTGAGRGARWTTTAKNVSSSRGELEAAPES